MDSKAKYQKIGSSYGIILPRRLMEAEGIKVGDIIVFHIEKAVELKKIKERSD